MEESVLQNVAHPLMIAFQVKFVTVECAKLFAAAESSVEIPGSVSTECVNRVVTTAMIVPQMKSVPIIDAQV